MKIFTLRNSNEVLVAAVAAFSLVAAVTTVSLVPQMARAADVVDSRAVTVRYSDLNLNTGAGVAVLYKRIGNAAKLVCGAGDDRRLEQVVAVRACVNGAIAASVAAVGNASSGVVGY